MAEAASFPLAILVPVPSSHWDSRLAVDLFAPEGTPVLAVFDGFAIAQDFPDGGHTVTVVAEDATHAYFAHLRQPGYSGAVRAGDVIGYVGTTGSARGTPPHLHFAVGRSIDSDGAGDIAPWDWLAGTGTSSVGNLVPLLLLAAGVVVALQFLD